jgi:hypothetical protein
MPWHDLPRAPAAPSAGVITANAVVKKAQQQLTSLRNKRLGADQRRSDLERDRETIALSVHGAGDKANRQRLTQINLEIATHASELASIDSAIVAGTAALATANAAAERAAQCADAESVIALCAQMREAGQLASEATTAMIARIGRYMSLVVEVHRLGHGVNPHLVTVNLRRSMGSALHPLGIGELQPPSQRVELGTLLQDYAARAEAAARRVLGEGANEEAA